MPEYVPRQSDECHHAGRMYVGQGGVRHPAAGAEKPSFVKIRRRRNELPQLIPMKWQLEIWAVNGCEEQRKHHEKDCRRGEPFSNGLLRRNQLRLHATRLLNYFSSGRLRL